MLIWITHVSYHFVDVQEAFFPFLTPMQSLKFFRLTQVYVWMDRQFINSGSGLETFSSEPANGNPEPHKRETVIPCHSHVDICVFETIGHVPPNSSHSAQPI